VIFFDFPRVAGSIPTPGGFFPGPKVDTIIQKLGSCSHLWVSGYRRWFINQGVPGSNPGGYLFFPKCIPWRVCGHILDSNVFGLKKSLFNFGPFWGRSRRIPGRLSSSAMQLGPRRTKYAKLRKRNHSKRTRGRRDLDLTVRRF